VLCQLEWGGGDHAGLGGAAGPGRHGCPGRGDERPLLGRRGRVVTTGSEQPVGLLVREPPEERPRRAEQRRGALGGRGRVWVQVIATIGRTSPWQPEPVCAQAPKNLASPKVSMAPSDCAIQ